jgi:TPR repeat protein
MKNARESIAACTGDVREKIEAAEEIISESRRVSREAAEMLKQAEELKQKAESMWYQGHNEMMEQTGSLPGCENILFTFANDMRRGEWGPSNYKKAIEIYGRLVEQKSEKYADLSLFWLAAMYLKGKYDDTQNKERKFRKQHLSNVAAADAYAKKIELSNPSLYKKYLDKKKKYLIVYTGW